MDEQSPEKSAEKPLQSLDLSALESLSLGPQWGSTESLAKKFSEYEEDEFRGNRQRGSNAQRRDRRPRFERPGVAAGAEGAPPPRSGPGGPGRGPGGPGRGPGGPGRGMGGGLQNRGPAQGEQPRRFDQGERARHPEGERDPRGGRGERFERRGPREERFQPIVEAAFYPEDTPFKALAQALKTSSRTFELFEIARLILQKTDRFVMVLKPLGSPAQTNLQFHVSVPDNVPFENEAEAIDHVFNHHLESFFQIETVEVDPPKGAFHVINRCTITGELLGPPNYHRYQMLIQQHHSSRLSNLSFERFQSKIESVRDPEVVQQWLQKMTKQTRYVIKNPPAGMEAMTFDNRDSARFYLITHQKESLVKTAATLRLEGKALERMPAHSRIRQSIEFILEHQRKFPLETANHLRGRLRRMNYTVYKKGAKGISYVCAVKRRFRTPDVKFADSVQNLIDFIEYHPNIAMADLPREYLGIVLPDLASAPAATPSAPAEADGAPAESSGAESTPTAESTPAPAAESTAAPAAPSTVPVAEPVAISAKDQELLKQMRIDLRWLVTEGYVIEYSNGRLLAPPPQAVPSERDDDEGESHAEAEVHAEEGDDAPSGFETKEGEMANLETTENSLPEATPEQADSGDPQAVPADIPSDPAASEPAAIPHPSATESTSEIDALLLAEESIPDESAKE